MPELTPGTTAQVLTEALRQALADALSQTLSSTWNVQVSSDEAVSASAAQLLCFAVLPSRGLQGNSLLQLRAADALLLAHKLQGETPDPAAELNDDRKKAVEKFMRGLAESAAVALKPQIGDVTFEVNQVEAPVWQGVTVVLTASDTAATFSLLLRLSAEMMTPITAEKAAMAPEATAPVVPDTQSVPDNLDLLMGIDLNLTLRFGEHTLTLREILDLSSGSVIELDRRVQEPADLLLGDKLIARGEVVIVDGNYGLRITEVSDPQHAAARGVLNSALR